MDKTHRLYPASYMAGGGLSKEAVKIINWLESADGEQVMHYRASAGYEDFRGATRHEGAYFGSIKEDGASCGPENTEHRTGCLETWKNNHLTLEIIDDLNYFGEQGLVWDADGQLLRPPRIARTLDLRTRLRTQILGTGDTSRSHP